MQIKRHKNKNEYCYSGNGLWVRNYTKPLVVAADINDLIPEQDMTLLLDNEVENHKWTVQQIDTEEFDYPHVAIVSDGYKFAEKQKLLEQLPAGVVIIGVNGAFIHWQARRRLNFYVVNNPYEECLQFLPSKAQGWPRCITSTRTFPKFLDKYQGIMYQYSPTPDQSFSGMRSEAEYFIDDYRNPICAAVGLAYRFKVQKLLLLCCDEVYEDRRVGSFPLANGLFTYPQQQLAHDLVNGNLYWLKEKGVIIGSHSGGADYTNASYIKAEDIIKFYE